MAFTVEFECPQSAEVTVFIMDSATQAVWTGADPNGYPADPAYTGPHTPATAGSQRNATIDLNLLLNLDTTLYLEARDADGYVLYRSRVGSPAPSSPPDSEDAGVRAAYVVSHPSRRWFVRAKPAVGYSARGQRSMVDDDADQLLLFDNGLSFFAADEPLVSRWGHVNANRADEVAGGGWHGQTHDAAGFALNRVNPSRFDKTGQKFPPATQNQIGYWYYLCEHYGQRSSLGDKIKTEEARVLLPMGLCAGLEFDDPLNLTRWVKEMDAGAPFVYPELPENLTCNAGLDLSWSEISILPTSLIVQDFIDLTGSMVADVPNFLWLTNYPGFSPVRWMCDYSNLHTFYSTVVYTRDFSARRCPLHRLPSEWHVDGDLTLDETPLRALPVTLVVSGRLSLRSTRLETLPGNLECHTLDLTDAIVDAWPESLPDVDSIVSDMDRRLIAELPEQIRSKVKRHA